MYLVIFTLTDDSKMATIDSLFRVYTDGQKVHDGVFTVSGINGVMKISDMLYEEEEAMEYISGMRIGYLADGLSDVQL